MPTRAHSYTNNALLLGHASEVARQGRTRNSEQFCRTTLGLICLLINDPDASFHSTCEREIDTRGAFVVIAGQRRNQFTTFQTHSDLAPDLEEKRHARAVLPNHCKTASWLARCGSIREGFRATGGEATSQSLRDELPCCFCLLLIQPLSTIDVGSSCSRTRTGG